MVDEKVDEIKRILAELVGVTKVDGFIITTIDERDSCHYIKHLGYHKNPYTLLGLATFTQQAIVDALPNHNKPSRTAVIIDNETKTQST